jgi:hypothetical protein
MMAAGGATSVPPILIHFIDKETHDRNQTVGGRNG